MTDPVQIARVTLRIEAKDGTVREFTCPEPHKLEIDVSDVADLGPGA